ncbi:MAG: FMN-binding domain protein [Hydrocarboniphaga sp.]|uniref:FMN-binding protein n=1 Tax=Hydrocarboniphaga sp. TaxID=2033016 RepID=UPI0026029782|nr:FMN-binding protein [Hydrocarboniphaga sp.]MDB5967774.1 FMN-binding domain protein [Hydrocarboniphaga sp.]
MPGLRCQHVALLLALATFSAGAEEQVMAPEAFLARAFHDEKPAEEVIWLDAPLQSRLRPILRHAYPRARLSYWRSGRRSAWVLDEIGKEFPITAGFVVQAGRIERANLLVYRESRGGEIRFPSFLKQFAGQRLDNGDQLSPDVDGVSGATLSVDAMRRMARAALALAAAADAKL